MLVLILAHYSDRANNIYMRLSTVHIPLSYLMQTLLFFDRRQRSYVEPLARSYHTTLIFW